MGRSPCCDKATVKRGPWSPEEDAVLKNFVERFGNGGNWITLPQKAGLRRCGKSCRLRWLNYLRPALRHGGFTDEEDNLILSLYGEIGSKWSVIASKLPGRTDNDVKNYWNTKLKKRYLATTTESSTPESPPPPPASTDNIAITAAGSPAPTPSPPCPPPLVFTDIETALDIDDHELLLKSDQWYAELVGLIEQSTGTTTTSTNPSEEVSATTPSPSDRSSPSTSSNIWHTSADDTFLLSETASLFGSYGANYDDLSSGSTHTFGAALPYSFQDFESGLLDTPFHDVMMSQ